MYIHRLIEDEIEQAVASFPVVALTGPRQCGKSTLARHLFESGENTVFLDLERPSDMQKLENAEWYLSSQKDKLICIDEIQRHPELFPLIRTLVDEWNRPGCFLILGSASQVLLKQSSESLAGRIVYKRLTPFVFNELNDYDLNGYIERGGFPRSILAKDDSIAYEWRESFISTFLERDLHQWAGFTTETMRRLWRMLAQVNGQEAAYSRLATSLSVSTTSVKRYVDLLSSTYMLDIVKPYHSNLGKRLVKSPKIYISDSGITSALLGIEGLEQLLGHPTYGSVWEQVVLSTITGNFPKAEVFFYRTTNGAEIDFVVCIKNKVFAVECKASYSPKLGKGNFNAIADISPDLSFVVSPSEECWSLQENIEVVSLLELVKSIKSILG